MPVVQSEPAAPPRGWVEALDEEFFAHAFERRPYVARGVHAGDLDELVALDTLEYLLISPPGAQFSYVRLGKVLPDGTWDVTKLAADLSLARLVQGYRDGYSILVDEAQARWPSLAAQCAALQERIARRGGVIAHNRATCGLFLTPPRAQGSAPHYDCKDVFAVQVAGSKTWRLHAPPVEAPLHNSADGEIDAPRLGEPVLEVTLGPGDLLYVPRGFVHAPLTRDERSLHLSFGVATITWTEILRPMLEARAELRQSVPARLLEPGAEEALRGALASLLAALDDAPEAAQRLRLLALASLVGETQVAAGRLADATAERSEELDDDVALEKRYGARCLVDRTGRELALAFPGRLLGVPLAWQPAVERVIASDRVTVGEVGRDVAAHLLDAGFLRRARPNGA